MLKLLTMKLLLVEHEVDFKYSDALEAADNIETFKFVVKTIAKKYGFHATFMPKLLSGINGSGMHLNMSLFSQDGTNAFFDENDKDSFPQLLTISWAV